MNFDEWYAENYVHWLKHEENYGEFSCRAYKAGEQSQQAEIDELKKRIDAIHDIIERAKKSRSGNYIINEIGNILKGKEND